MEDEARARVHEIFPQLNAASVRPIGTGWTVDTYEVDGTWIVQFARDSYAADRLRAQIEVLPELAAELSALVPEPVYADREAPAIAYRKIEGQPLDQAPDGLWPERLGRFLYDLHLLPPEYVGLRGQVARVERARLSDELAGHRRDVLPLLECERGGGDSARDSIATSTTTRTGDSRRA